MKHVLKISLMSLILLSGISALAINEILTSRVAFEEISVVPKAIYTPIGFDTNDNAQVVIEGTYPNTCYKSSNVTYKVDHSKKEIWVENKVIRFTNSTCLQISVDYTKVIDLGILESQGNYKLKFKSTLFGGYTYKANLSIAEATSNSQDDYTYAPISSVLFSEKESTFYLRGFFPESCMTMLDVKIINPEKGNTVNILPVAKITEGCSETEEKKEFIHKVLIDRNVIGKGRFLFHIRSLNGQALNQIISL